ncbi:MAG: biotin-dependent carboxyltransferase family protein [Verrucomicrobiota bacterium]
MSTCLEILSTGVGCSIQDSGRPGWRRFGVPPGGVLDQYSMRVANALLGNRPSAPVMELLMQGQKLRVLEDTWIAVAGADLGGRIAPWSAECVPEGSVLTFPSRRSGLWAYLAVPGGFQVDQWFGSASTDLRNGLGVPLKKGSLLESGKRLHPDAFERIGRREYVFAKQRAFEMERSFKILPGPQFEAFDPTTRAQLVGAKWTVSSQSDRTGFRLQGPLLKIPPSIPSEPVLPGSFQITGSGQPIVTMADGPTVGGYAKLAVLPERDLDWLAQCPPGAQLSFQWVA